MLRKARASRSFAARSDIEMPTSLKGTRGGPLLGGHLPMLRPLVALAQLVAIACPLHVSVETWLMLPHSYGIVGQEIALHLQMVSTGAVRLPQLLQDVKVTVLEAPPYQSTWINKTGLRPSAQEAALLGIPVTPPDSCPDLVFRAYFPLNFAPWPLHAELNKQLKESCRPLVFTFGTTEYRVAIPEMIANVHWGFDSLARSANVFLLPPSKWAMEGFLASGVAPEKMLLLPHGFDRALYRSVR